MHFLTDLDPNARVKGSRDPLGIQSVWSRLARRTIGGLTTQTTSLDDFRILVVGAALIDRMDESVPSSAAFVCWEQLASYARLQAGRTGFRGITRASQRYRRSVDHKEIRPVSASRADQTLTNQAGYGIWGLYRSTAWATGLLSQGRPYVRRPELLSLVEAVYIPRLEQGWGKDLRSLLASMAKGIDLRPWLAEDRKRLEAIASAVLGPLVPQERELYREYLLRGGSDHPEGGGSIPAEVRRRQRALFPLLQRTTGPDGITQASLLTAASEADDDLSEVLHDIVAVGAVLDASSRCFVYLSQQIDTTLEVQVAHLEQQFADAAHLVSTRALERVAHLAASRPALLRAPDESETDGRRWLHVAQSLHDKDFETLLRLLVQQNEAVSRSKGSATGWVSVTESGAVKAAVRAAGSGLPSADEIGELWMMPFYIPNLLMLAEAVDPKRSS